MFHVYSHDHVSRMLIGSHFTYIHIITFHVYSHARILIRSRFTGIHMRTLWSLPCEQELPRNGMSLFVAVDYCSSNPCDESGTNRCESAAGTYRCDCKAGYAGGRCETSETDLLLFLCQSRKPYLHFCDFHVDNVLYRGSNCWSAQSYHL